MKKLSCLVLAGFICLSAFAQKDKDIPSYGKVDKAELELSSCPFDKDADVMKLLETCDMEFQKGNHLLFALKIEKRVRLKVLKPMAVNHGDIRLYYVSDDNYEKMYSVDASTYNLDATGKTIETKVDKKSFYKEKVTDNVSAIKFSFPEVKAGSVLEYRYTIIRENLSHIDPWYFQDSIPTRLSYLRIAIPEWFKFTTNALLNLPLEKKTDEFRTSIMIGQDRIEYKNEEYIYKMKDLPGLKYEPFMTARRDYLQKIMFQLRSIEVPGQMIVPISNTWQRVAKNLREHPYFGSQIRKNLMKSDAMNTLLISAKTQDDKVKSIFEHVQRQMDWNGVHSIYSNNVKEAYNNKKGTSGDINLILVNMLKDAGITAHPVIVSTRDHGQIINSYPFLDQFNHVVVVAFCGDNAYVLDASDGAATIHLIPSDILGVEAFIIEPESERFVTLWNPADTYCQFINLEGNINEDGVLSGECSISSQAYARSRSLRYYRAGKDKYVEHFYNTGDMKVTDFEVENEKYDADTLPLMEYFKFSCPVNSSGDYKYFAANLFSNMGKNPFTAEKRFTNVDFGYNQQYVFTGKINIPEGYEFETPPKNLAMIMPDTSIIFRRYVEVKGNMAAYRITLDFKRPAFGADEYPEFKEFYKLLFDKMNEQFVFKKKS